MKKFIFIALTMALSLPAYSQNSTPVQSSKDDWKVELAQFQDSLKGYSNNGIRAALAWYGAKMVGTCSASAAITGAVFIADTLPLTNILSEGLGNLSAPDYKTYNDILKLENLASLGRGTIGGGGVALLESLEYIFLVLGGNDQNWEALSKVYASTAQTAEALFAEKSLCRMSMAKAGLAARELGQRTQATGGSTPSPVLPVNPAEPGVYNDDSQNVIPTHRLP